MEKIVSDLLKQKSCTTSLLDSAENDRSRLHYARKIKMKQLKQRSLGSGHKKIIDESGERFVAKAIEEKSTAQGRKKIC